MFRFDYFPPEDKDPLLNCYWFLNVSIVSEFQITELQSDY